LRKVHPTAMVHPGAQLDPEVEIGPYCYVGDKVSIEAGTRICDHARVEGWTRIGKGCQLYPFAVVGAAPQDLKYKGEPTELIVGPRNIFREFCTIHRGTVSGGGRTIIGSDNVFMAYSHVAHDCKIGNHVILANGATLAGHIEIQDHAIIGGLVAIHQFVRIGAYAMVGGFSGIAQDVPPYMLASGSRARLYGLNVVGLKRHGFSKETIQALRRAYRILFRSALVLQVAVDKIRRELPSLPEIENLISFVQESKRGICR
jgi:UDP-N-acetylglucosamine acyltransferase